MRRRQKPRLDYSKLHSTGVVSIKETDNTIKETDNTDSELSQLFADSLSLEDNTMDEVQKLKVDISVLSSDILDLIDENPIDEHLDKDVINKLEELRSTFKQSNLHLQIAEPQVYAEKFETSYQKTLSIVKAYIKSSKECKIKIDLADIKAKTNEKIQKEKSMMFLADDINRCIDHLAVAYSQNISDGKNEDLRSWKKEQEQLNKQFERVAMRYQELLTFTTNNDDFQKCTSEIAARYEKLSSSKTSFASSLTKAINDRELDKQSLFNEANLNIKLQKFSGYDSPTDVYSFQTDFEKVYLRTTPRRLLSDLLLNNYVCDPALSLVKGLQDIDEIWRRLRQAYGDTKIMFTKKLNQISKLEPMSRTRDPEKVIFILSKLINSIRDLVRIATDHKIENRLYFGDGLQRIYKLMDDRRVERWLSSICDNDLDEDEQWRRLLVFLEKEMRLQQQKVLLHGNKVEKDRSDTVGDKNPTTKTLRYKNSSYPSYNPSLNEEPVCYICDEKGSSEHEHVATSGPGGIKVIQYFTCRKFVNKTPAERLALLKDKDLCFQCLLPGAKASAGKHNEGRCQRDFVCKHINHQKYPTRKHVLVCDEHKHTTENKELLEHYKHRCIKNQNLPSFSREIKLSSFHTDVGRTGKSYLTNNTNGSEETGIFCRLSKL